MLKNLWKLYFYIFGLKLLIRKYSKHFQITQKTIHIIVGFFTKRDFTNRIQIKSSTICLGTYADKMPDMALCLRHITYVFGRDLMFIHKY